MNTVELCERELAAYMSRMTGKTGKIALVAEGSDDLFAEHYVIAVKEGSGEIRANRPRALLLGVYDFLRRCGCRFVRPGRNGEVIPSKDLSEITVFADVTPKNRHRGITIEGAVSVENVLDLIEWAPKVGFNSYFIQFRTAFEFFNRWYSHENNATLAPESFTQADSERFVARIVGAIKERDMIYHAVGHGWTASCVGIDSNGWKGVKDELTDEQREMLAEVDGTRKFFHDIPLNTHLCYSNRTVRERMAEKVVSYAEEHPEIDVLHFWLADDSNNVCECDACGKKRLSDWYVMMLNDIDRRMSAIGLKTKICFLVYLDLYWPPETERIENQDRFIMMFAPIFRSYERPYDCSESGQNLEYVKNHVAYPHTTSAYVRFLRQWKTLFSGDSFDFDYHLMWDINRDFGGEILADVLYRDIRSLSELDLNGFMSCQIQRAFYPNGLAFYVMGRALEDGEASYEALRSEYYTAAFGKNAAFASRFYEEIEKDMLFSYMKEEASGTEALPGIVKAQTFIRETLAAFPEFAEDETRAESLALLRFVAENILRLARVLELKITGAADAEIAAANEERKDFFNRNELRFQPYADGFYVNMIVDGIVSAKEVGIYAN